MSRAIEITSGKIAPNLLRMAGPLVATNVLQILFGAVDMIVVGNFANDTALAAVGSTAELLAMFVLLFLGVSVGANAVASFYSGARDDEQVSKTVHTSIALSFFCGTLMTFVGAYYADDMLRLMRSPTETLEQATIYLRLYFCGSIPMLIFDFGSSLLRAKGNSKSPLYYLSFAGTINVGLNVLFTLVFHMDVAGVAIATVVSQCVSAGLVLRRLTREKDAYRFEFSRLQLDRKIVFKILRIGLPAGFQGVLFSFANTVVQSAINGFGPIVMSGSAASSTIEAFVWISMSAFSQCALTFTSQNIGAKNYERINKIAAIALFFTAVVGITIGNVSYLFGETLIGVFDARPEAIAAGMRRALPLCCLYWLYGLTDCLVGSIRGMGSSMTPTIVSLIGVCGLRVAWVALFFRLPSWHTEGTLYSVYPISWILTLLAHSICYFVIRRRYPKKNATSAA